MGALFGTVPHGYGEGTGGNLPLWLIQVRLTESTKGKPLRLGGAWKRNCDS